MKNCNPLKLYCFALLTFFATMASGQVTIGSPGPNATITCDATPTFTTPTASSSCSGVTVNELSSITSGNTCQTVITKSWEATDDCGNTSATVSQKITIVDIVAPAIGPAGVNVTLACTGTPSFTAPTASDACNAPTVNLLSSFTTGNSCSFTLSRTWDATDACGNHSAIRSQSITMVDLPPSIGPAGSNATIVCSGTPTFTAPTASDACGAPTVNLLSSFTTGNSCSFTLSRIWDATDACGNHSATRSQSITVVDNQAPAIGAPGANATIDCTATPSFTTPTASDNCGPVTIIGLTATIGSGCFQTITRRLRKYKWSCVANDHHKKHRWRANDHTYSR